jgi:eukaryotic-like serine/threonine-protein kinase
MSQPDDDDDDSDPLLAKIARRPQRHAPLHLIGTRRFELVRKLGSGAFGEVYEARDREHGSVVALKTLKSSHPDWIYRFKREFRIVGDLAHRNLVRMFELFVEDERWYLTMELIHGIPFDEHLRRTPAQLRSCFAQLALGLSELHAAGCLHRDVKPSNALVDATGKVVLLDFGLAVHQHAAVATAIAGTAPYMAPELGLRQAPTEASDWYAFGVMLYETLAGERPFAGDEAEMLRAKLRDSPPPPSDLRNGVDATLESLSLRLLSPEPAVRPTTTELLRALHASTPVPSRSVAAPIVGRRDELAILAAACETSRDRPVVVAVSGPPGIGKTALIGAFVEELRARGEPVYQGRCLERESVPFKGIDAAIDELSNDLSRRSLEELEQLVPADVSALATVFPMIARIPSVARITPRSPDRSALGQDAARALRELFARLGHVVIVIDDLQWTSADSIDLLLELLSPPAPSMLVIVVHQGIRGQRAPIVERFVSSLIARTTSPITIELDR